MVGLPDSEIFFEDMFIRFDTIHERNGQTDRMTDTHIEKHRMTAKAALA